MGEQKDNSPQENSQRGEYVRKGGRTGPPVAKPPAPRK